MYTVFKITTYPYMVKCCAFENLYDAIAEAEWAEEHGEGQFLVIETI